MAELYAEWNKINREKLSLYYEKKEPDISLENNKEFRSLKNDIIRAAVHWAITGYVLIGLLLLLLLQYIVYQSVKKKKDRVIEQQRITHQAEIEIQEKKIIELEKVVIH